jgi:hypothetical protein
VGGNFQRNKFLEIFFMDECFFFKTKKIIIFVLANIFFKIKIIFKSRKKTQLSKFTCLRLMTLSFFKQKINKCSKKAQRHEKLNLQKSVRNTRQT